MFGSIAIGAVAPSKVDPNDIPGPTPVNLPRYQPFARPDAELEQGERLSTLLQHTGRANGHFLGAQGLSAIGLNLTLDAALEQIVPEPSFIPNFREWESLTPEEARGRNASTKVPIRNGNVSPGCSTYLERVKELSHTNEDGFRTVRRIAPPKGKQHARLGNAYEFFRCLEQFTSFWDDPTQPPDLPPSPESGLSESTPAETDASAKTKRGDEHKFVRISAGHSMPSEYRQNLLSAFIKLVAYDFGCNVSMARTEPRLQLSSGERSASLRKSYYASNCSFIFQSPTTREAARAGNVYGPVAVVSARPTTDFTNPDLETVQSQDLAREVLAALVTAQHRCREGKTEARFGEGQWWTSKPRWGGGAGGPIGREIDRDVVQGDKDSRPSDVDGMPAPKKARKNMSMYDNYRMIRPPAHTWDRKAQYEAIGRTKGSEHDNIFVLSSLFHHISIIRVQVPTRLLEVLEGAPEPESAQRSWGGVQAWRSPWYDMFAMNDRVEAMRCLWGVMAYQMRTEALKEDVTMEDA